MALLVSHLAASSNAKLARQIIPSGTFKYPPGPAATSATLDFDKNPQWAVGEAQTIQWEWEAGAWPIYAVYLHNYRSQASDQDGKGPVISKSQGGSTADSAFGWRTTPGDFDLSASNVFFLRVSDDAEEFEHTFDSGLFNITEAASSSKASETRSTSLTAATTTTTAAATLERTEPPTADSRQTAPGPLTPNSVLSAQPTFSSSLAESPKQKHTLPLALGIALGLGIPLALLGAIFLRIKLMHTQRPGINPQNQPVDQRDTAVAELQSPLPQYSDLPEYRPPEKSPIKA